MADLALAHVAQATDNARARVGYMAARSVVTSRLSLFNDLVGTAEQRKRYRQSQRPGGFEIDDQFDPRRLDDREVGGLLTSENAARVDASLPERVRDVSAVAHQPASRGKLAILVRRREG